MKPAGHWRYRNDNSHILTSFSNILKNIPLLFLIRLVYEDFIFEIFDEFDAWSKYRPQVFIIQDNVNITIKNTFCHTSSECLPA